MPDSKRFLHPEAILRISRLDLRARHIVEGFLSGIHRSPYFGQSVEFLQHREYVAGDDLRHVDWKVWARQDRLYIKQFEEDTNMRVTLLVDVSNSMDYGEGLQNKSEYANTVAASIGYLVLRQQDALGCVSFDSDVREKIPQKSKRNHINSVVHSLNVNKPAQKTDLYKILSEVAQSYPRRGMMILVSDFLSDVELTLKGLRMLRRQGHDVLVFHVLHDDEIDFEFSGSVRFEGLESDDFLNCNPRSLRDEYTAIMQKFLQQLRHGCANKRSTTPSFEQVIRSTSF